MLFSDLAFIYVFLPLTYLVYFLVGKKFKNLVLVLAGIIFYFYGEPKYGFLLLITTLITYGFGLLIAKKKKKIWLVLAVIVSLSFLVYFKYTDFLITTLNSLLNMDLKLANIILPIGISFYTFQQLSYLVDVYRKPEVVQKNLIDYATYIMLFPQLIAGPIVRYGDIRPQLQDHPVTREKLSAGIFRFVIGLGKKVLIANVLGELVSKLQIVSPTFTSAWVEAIAYTLQLYFDFSGYSDMAIGLGKMLGFEFLENFNYPLFASSITDFWRRWHISLGNWFRDYVYIPLGGSKKGKARTILNTMIVFALSGLWHGANWTFITWGILQGLLVVWDNLGIVGIKKTKEKKPARFHLPRFVGWLFTFSFFNLSLYFFRSNTMTDAFQLLKNLFAFKETGYLLKLVPQLDIPEFYLIKQVINMVQPELLTSAYVLLFFLIMLISAFILTRRNSMELVDRVNYNSKLCWGLTILFVWSVISFSQVSTFIYFNF